MARSTSRASACAIGESWSTENAASSSLAATYLTGIQPRRFSWGERTAAGDSSYVGRVEHGIGRQLATALALIRVTRSPFADGPRRGVFVRPLVEVEVERLAFDSTLRHARLVRLLVDGQEVGPTKRSRSG